MIDKSELVSIVEAAFHPLTCVAELQNYEHAFGFRIYLPDGRQITHEVSNASLLLHEAQLNSLVQHYRDKIAQGGVQLHSWVSLPTL